MEEKLQVYDLDGNFLEVQSRKAFYTDIRQEFQKTGKITRKVKAIRLIRMNSQGRIFLQRRSNIKSENPNLFDKTVGAHVAAGHSFDMTVTRECAEELGFPATVVPESDFDEIIRTTDLNIVGVFRSVERMENFESIRIDKQGSKMIQPYISEMYVGYYDGHITFLDGEASGLQVYSVDELKEAIQADPHMFTEDVKFMFQRYERYLRAIE